MFKIRILVSLFVSKIWRRKQVGLFTWTRFSLDFSLYIIFIYMYYIKYINYWNGHKFIFCQSMTYWNKLLRTFVPRCVRVYFIKWWVLGVLGCRQWHWETVVIMPVIQFERHAVLYHLVIIINCWTQWQKQQEVQIWLDSHMHSFPKCHKTIFPQFLSQFRLVTVFSYTQSCCTCQHGHTFSSMNWDILYQWLPIRSTCTPEGTSAVTWGYVKRLSIAQLIWKNQYCNLNKKVYPQVESAETPEHHVLWKLISKWAKKLKKLMHK